MRSKLTRLFCVLALSLFAAAVARAEYRVYKLGITYLPGEKEHTVLSTLDHYQYPTYYQLTSTQTTRLIEHWRCNGDTSDFKTYCKNPNPPVRAEPESATPQQTSVTPQT